MTAQRVHFLFLAVLFTIILAVGLIPQAIFPMDSFVLINGAWRVANGLVPYRDFGTLYGPGHYYVLAGMMGLTHESPLALPLSIAVTLVPVSLLAWRVASVRYGPGIALLLSTYLSMIWGSSIPLHFLFFESSYAMFENREGYVMVCLIFLLVLPTKRHEANRGTDILVGLLLGILIFIKLNYAVSAGLLILALTRGKFDTRPLWLMLGLLLGILPFMLLLGLDSVAAMVIGLHHIGILRSTLWLKDQLPILGIEIPAGFVFLFDLHKRAAPNKKVQRPEIIQLLIILFIAASLEFGSYPVAHFLECPLLACYGFTLLTKIQVNRRDLFNLGTSVLGVSGLSYLNLLFGLLFPMISPLLYPKHYLDQVRSISYPLVTITVPSTKTEITNWGAFINDGIELIRRHPELAQSQIASLEVTDLFNYPLLHCPTPHTPVWMSFGVTLSLSDYPKPSYILDDAEALMIPKHEEAEFNTYGRIPEYHNYVNQNFIQCDESVNWVLWKRRSFPLQK